SQEKISREPSVSLVVSSSRFPPCELPSESSLEQPKKDNTSALARRNRLNRIRTSTLTTQYPNHEIRVAPPRAASLPRISRTHALPLFADSLTLLVAAAAVLGARPQVGLAPVPRAAVAVGEARVAERDAASPAAADAGRVREGAHVPASAAVVLVPG